jgi:hypothetical protein
VRVLGHPGYISALGEWGPIVHGGAWLTVDGLTVDVLFRDLDVVEPWMEDARQGRFQVLAQSGHVVGAPTYLPIGELALSLPLAGEELPRPPFPEALATAAPARWESRASMALMFAERDARTRDVAPCAGMLASAVLCGAHARLAARGEWALNEKRLVRRAGLEEAEPVLAAVGHDPARAVQDVSELLRIQPLAIR